MLHEFPEVCDGAGATAQLPPPLCSLLKVPRLSFLPLFPAPAQRVCFPMASRRRLHPPPSWLSLLPSEAPVLQASTEQGVQSRCSPCLEVIDSEKPEPENGEWFWENSIQTTETCAFRVNTILHLILPSQRVSFCAIRSGRYFMALSRCPPHSSSDSHAPAANFYNLLIFLFQV